MKRTIVLIILLLAVIALSGCDEQAVQQQDPLTAKQMQLIEQWTTQAAKRMATTEANCIYLLKIVEPESFIEKKVEVTK